MAHSDHASTDEEAQRIYGTLGANLITNPYDRYNDAKRWQTSPQHFSTIMRTNRMGCSAPEGSCPTIFCYHAIKP